MRRSKHVAFVIVSLATIVGCAQLLREYRPDLRSWYCPYHYKIYNVIAIHVPITCLLVCNTGIIRAVHKSNKDRSRLSRTQRSSSQEKSITTTTVIVTCIFIISNIPVFFDQYLWQHINYDRASKAILQLQYFTVNFSILMESLNYCLNFYMYGLSCKRFRNELRVIITCRNKKHQQKASFCHR
jgi:hypothetical protein